MQHYSNTTLAKLYSSGRGVAKSEGEAFRLEKIAAERGHAYAQSGLGLHYLQGRGTTRDAGEAIKWLSKAVDQGRTEAQFNLGKLYEKGDGIPANYAQAFKWYEKAASAGDAVSQFSLCSMYRQGRGVEKNMQEAFKWCAESANQGNPQALVSAGIFAYGYFPEIKPDYTRAIYWWGHEARAGNADAQFLLGMAYDSGKGVQKNSAEAHKWYELAARQGNPQAIARLNKR